MRHTTRWLSKVCLCIISSAIEFGCGTSIPTPTISDTQLGDPNTSPVDRPHVVLHEQTVNEGDTVVLQTDEIPSSTGSSKVNGWTQIYGPTVEITNQLSRNLSFVAPQVTAASLLVFRFSSISGDRYDVNLYVIHVMNAVAPSDSSLCGGVVCETGTQCNKATGACQATFGVCENVICSQGETCDDLTGNCVAASPCSGVTCSSNQHCNPATGSCESTCVGVTCPAGTQLNADHCTCEAISLCKSVTCPAGQNCDPATGSCVTVDPCQNVSCSGGSICDAQTGQCVSTGGCADPPTGAVFTVTDSSVGTNQYDINPNFWIEFSMDLDPQTFSPDILSVQQAGPDNAWSTADDVVVSTTAQLNCCRRIAVSLAPQDGALAAGRRYRVQISPGCLKATASNGVTHGLDGEFSGMFPTGNGAFGGVFVQEFIGVAPGPYSGDLVCNEETRDILGRVTQETKHYNDTITVDPAGMLVLAGQPVQVGSTMNPPFTGIQLEMTVTSVTPQRTGIHVTYDVSGLKDNYQFTGPQEETYIFVGDGTILHAGTSSFNVNAGSGAVVATVHRTCSGTLKQ
ncbi:MAG: hypothetical protein HY287_01045 [Planctomycetes bacterium]|nr:hypothetical protein [Planctomycetota bacterium]MBI3832894.1 hypothetical protein [Planctomycetota bacterium]